MVVAAHASLGTPAVAPWTASGVAGVDIFFVISGFIMAHSTSTFEPNGDLHKQAFGFMKRRIIRIVPLYWIALLWTIKVPLIKGQFESNYLLDFLFLPRIHSTGAIWPELIAGWTINYEMFFYAAFAGAMLAGVKRYAVLALALFSLIALGAVTQPAATPLKFYTSPLLLEFLMGIGTYYMCNRLSSTVRWAWLVFLGAFALLALGNGPLPRALADGLPAAMVVWAGVQIGRGTNFRGLRLVGDASYSIYLAHLGVISLLDKAALIGYQQTTSVPALDVFLRVIFASAIGVTLHFLVEKPMLRLFQGTPSRRQLSAGA